MAAPGGLILILGGTSEARELADALVARGHRVLTSLAGVTRNPSMPAGEVRIGGLGGVEGLASLLLERRVRLLVDATHPFAAAVSRHAAEAARQAGIPLLRLERPAWRPQDGDRWTLVPDAVSAAAALPSEAHVLLTIGRKDIGPFMARPDLAGVLRMIEPPGVEVPERWEVLLARPPFSVEAEYALLRSHGIEALVSKNSGGATEAKLEAARQLGLPVVMIERASKPAAETRATVESMLALIETFGETR